MMSSEASVGTRLKDWFVHLPLVTRTITVLCVGIYVVGLIIGQDDYSVCTYPPLIVEEFQVYRLLTSGFFHVGFLHLVMNMLAFQALAPSLERSLGSFTLAYLVILFQVLSSLLSAFLSLLLLKTDVYPGAWNQCTIGLSSVLFSFLVLRSHAHQSQSMSIFGMVSVPAMWYPWVLLIVFQLIMPEVSFIGHLSGIVVAYLYVMGYMELLKLSSATINKIEASSLLEWLVLKDGYITNTQFGIGGNSGELPTHQTSSNSSSSSGGLMDMVRGMMARTSAQTEASPSAGGATPPAKFVPFSGEGRTLRGSVTPPAEQRPSV